MVQLSHPDRSTGETIALTMLTFVSKVMYMLFKTLCRFVIAFLPRSKCRFISRLQSPSTVILEPKKIKSATVSTFSLSICHENQTPWSSFFECWVLSQFFHSPLLPSSRGSLISPSLSAIRVVSSALSEVVDISPGNLDSSLWVIQPGIFAWCTLHIS